MSRIARVITVLAVFAAVTATFTPAQADRFHVRVAYRGLLAYYTAHGAQLNVTSVATVAGCYHNDSCFRAWTAMADSQTPVPALEDCIINDVALWTNYDDVVLRKRVEFNGSLNLHKWCGLTNSPNGYAVEYQGDQWDCNTDFGATSVKSHAGVSIVWADGTTTNKSLWSATYNFSCQA